MRTDLQFLQEALSLFANLVRSPADLNAMAHAFRDVAVKKSIVRLRSLRGQSRTSSNDFHVVGKQRRESS
jgi:hypothetical protein